MSPEFVKVPFHIESDGSKTLFLPNLRHPKGFQVGEKDNERYVADYWEALAELMKMSAPKFRRPNKSNNRGIVACKFGDVDEVKRSYLNEELANNQIEGGPHGR